MKRLFVAVVCCLCTSVCFAQDIRLKPYKLMPSVTEETNGFLIHYNMSAIMYAYNLLPKDVQAKYHLPKWIINRKITVSDKENKMLKDLLDREVGAYLLMSGLAVIETPRYVQIRVITAKEGIGYTDASGSAKIPYSFTLPQTSKVIFAGTMNKILRKDQY